VASPYHADHVGSLLRPQELLDARKDPRSRASARHHRGSHILGVLKRQKDAGLEIFTDGAPPHRLHE
jgi:5-methyltetrahydropteroyltriglutamate--homocysteine methyltransferase